MTLATVFARAQNGLTADLVTVEVHLAPGLPGLNIVGLPEASVREAKDRVRAAISNSGYRFPLQRITCNLAPADLPKDGSRFDLAIALGILAPSQPIPRQPHDEIGRASCRERGCQSVELSVVAAYLKKKNKK